MLTDKFSCDGWKIVRVNGKKAPAHLQSLRIPPAWSQVKVDPTSTAVVLATGFDEKGRQQRLYSKEHTQAAKDSKFGRVKQLLNEMDDIEKQIRSDLKTSKGKAREAHLVSLLIFLTGMRPGSKTDTKANIQAYGATTLKTGHVKPTVRGVRLVFIGKKGVKQSVPVTDPLLVEELISRKEKAGMRRHVDLFNVSSTYLNQYIGQLGSGQYSAKDFRTMRGTHLALKLLGGRTKFPKAKSRLKALINNALDKVAKMLGNTRTVSKNSYVEPSIIENILNRRRIEGIKSGNIKPQTSYKGESK